MWDDIIYVSLLLAAIAYGKVTRTVSANPEIRKWLSSIGGLAIVLTVSGKIFSSNLFQNLTLLCFSRLSCRSSVGLSPNPYATDQAFTDECSSLDQFCIWLSASLFLSTLRIEFCPVFLDATGSH